MSSTQKKFSDESNNGTPLAVYSRGVPAPTFLHVCNHPHALPFLVQMFNQHVTRSKSKHEDSRDDVGVELSHSQDFIPHILFWTLGMSLFPVRSRQVGLRVDAWEDHVGLLSFLSPLHLGQLVPELRIT